MTVIGLSRERAGAFGALRSFTHLVGTPPTVQRRARMGPPPGPRSLSTA